MTEQTFPQVPPLFATSGFDFDLVGISLVARQPLFQTYRWHTMVCRSHSFFDHDEILGDADEKILKRWLYSIGFLCQELVCTMFIQYEMN